PPDGQTNWLSELKRAKLRYNPLRNFFIRRALKNVDYTFAVSSALEAALKRSGVRVDDVVYNGIDEKEWRADAKIIESFVAAHVLEGRKPIFFGGRISDQKGGSAALEALSIVAAKIPEAVLLVAGRENAYMQKLKARAESLGISKNLVPIGWLSGSELRAAYHASRAVIIPSLYLDPLPTVALEAMACKKPVVASRNGGLPEIVADGQTGLIADPANPPAFAEAIASLLLDEHTAKALGEKGYARANELFSFDAETAKLLSWYEK
ncbi:MAG TPA: glycosyltransferase family 4 protein, partial [Candidatus Paceibacterota bacterium]|nr:glycosyltransferase family 4 protein [Candidatus Paceibacterota bacterium]